MRKFKFELVSSLSKRERQIFDLIGEGMSPSKIISTPPTCMAEQTYGTHCRNITLKLGLSSGCEMRTMAAYFVSLSSGRLLSGVAEPDKNSIVLTFPKQPVVNQVGDFWVVRVPLA